LLPYIKDPKTRRTRGNIMTDEVQIANLVGLVAWRQEPSLFVDFMKTRWQMNDEEAKIAVGKILRGEPYLNTLISRRPIYGLRDFISRDMVTFAAGTDQAHKAAKIFRDFMMKKGWVGLRYMNTAPMETETATKFKSYIVFDPKNIRSAITGEVMGESFFVETNPYHEPEGATQQGERIGGRFAKRQLHQILPSISNTLIPGLPNEVIIKDRTLEEAINRGVWVIKAKEVKDGRYRITLSGEPQNPLSEVGINVGTFKRRDTDENVEWYDKRYAEIETETFEHEGKTWVTHRAKLKKEYASEYGAKRPNVWKLKNFSQEKGWQDDPNIIYRGMSAEEFESIKKNGYVESRGDYNIGDEQKGQTFWSTDPRTAESYANGFAPWPYVATFDKPAYVIAIHKPANAVIRPEYPEEVAVPGRISKEEIIGVWQGEVYSHRPGEYDLNRIGYSGNEYQTGGGVAAASYLLWNRNESLLKTREEKMGVKMATIAPPEIDQIVRETCQKVDFNPENVVYTTMDRDFTLNGRQYKYAGSYSPGASAVVLYLPHVTKNSVAGLVAHEIAHRKWDAFLRAYKKERDAMLADPGPPPDPNGEYIWQKRGGTDGMMKADGTLRPPYDSKYPLYVEFERIYQIDKLSKEDGVTPYSREYWTEWFDHNMTTDSPVTETLSEIAYLKQKYQPLGKIEFTYKVEKETHELPSLKDYYWWELPKKEQTLTYDIKPSKRWMQLYNLMETVWNKLPSEEREKVYPKGAYES
jgi:hypothetical protein